MGISGTSSGFLLGYCTLRSSETPVARTGSLAVGAPRKGLGSFVGRAPPLRKHHEGPHGPRAGALLVSLETRLWKALNRPFRDLTTDRSPVRKPVSPCHGQCTPQLRAANHTRPLATCRAVAAVETGTGDKAGAVEQDEEEEAGIGPSLPVMTVVQTVDRQGPCSPRATSSTSRTSQWTAPRRRPSTTRRGSRW